MGRADGECVAGLEEEGVSCRSMIVEFCNGKESVVCILGLNIMNANTRVEELFTNKRPPAVGTTSPPSQKTYKLLQCIFCLQLNDCGVLHPHLFLFLFIQLLMRPSVYQMRIKLNPARYDSVPGAPHRISRGSDDGKLPQR